MSLIINANPEKQVCKISNKKISVLHVIAQTTYDVINTEQCRCNIDSITLVDRVESVINPSYGVMVWRARAYAKKVPNENGKEDDGRCVYVHVREPSGGRMCGLPTSRGSFHTT